MNARSDNPPASCIICATPRCGSTLLCDLLHDTGVAGNPHSFFRNQDFAEWAEEFNVPVGDWQDHQTFDIPYLEAVLKYGAGSTELFGMRLMWESLGNLSDRLETLFPGLPSDSSRFQSAFGQPVYLHLSRQDKVAQAVSRCKAEQTGLWHVDADGTERERVKSGKAPRYDADELARLVRELEDQDAAWTGWFTRQGVVPVCITYEKLSSDPQTTLALVLSALGQDKSIAGSVEPRTAKLADNESLEWVTRFKAERCTQTN
ncbi:Stf0 family sulfotransferase [Anderseniella sp. Alg231-50]|uniref:Stf0 family sulfotransferase n=1 Tax=Anderseniella sp. Alg231-50 TaxID=1922226 RepID=UPI000D55AE62